MQVRCPECHTLAEYSDETGFDAVECAECGNRIEIVADSTISQRPAFRQGSDRTAVDETHPKSKTSVTDLAPAGSAVQTFGHFELIYRLGMGAFGSVWKARDTQLDRIVAIKIPRKGDLDEFETDQFLREARAAAQLKHPHIVSIHEVGRYDETVYIAADYVDGMDLKEWLTRHHPSALESAKLTVTISEALHHAHEAGVIHRDLKPANIMLDKQNQPHIMDFGLAKRESGEVTLTVEGQLLGTPAYMSPEQARGEGHIADRRCDVYSLGVILYQLLTEELPFRGDQRMLIVSILKDEPTPPRRLNARIPRDLETICLKCLEKDAGRRYATAQDLADDLTRYVKGEPILARPLGRTARLWRWCKRQPVVATLLAVVLLTLATGTTVSTYFAIEANHRAIEAERTWRKAREAVDNLYTKVSEDTLLNEPGMQTLRHELLSEALEYYQWFLKERQDEHTVRHELAANYFRAGLIIEHIESADEAVEYYLEAAKIQRRLVDADPSNTERLKALSDTLNALGRALYLSRRADDARKTYEEALALRSRLVDLAPGDAESVRKLANSHMNLGTVHQDQGDTGRAQELFAKAQAIRTKQLDVRDHRDLRRDLAMGYYNLATLNLESEKIPLARQYLLQSAEQFETVLNGAPDDLRNQHRLSLCYRVLGDVETDLDKAFTWYRKSGELLETLVRKNPAVPRYQEDLASLNMNLGGLQHEMQQHDKAAQALQRATELLQLLVSEFPDQSHFRRDLAVSKRGLGSVRWSLGDVDSARTLLAESQTTLKELVSQSPGNDRLKFELQVVEDTLQQLEQSSNAK